jgi:hypothetical protein
VPKKPKRTWPVPTVALEFSDHLTDEQKDIVLEALAVKSQVDVESTGTDFISQLERKIQVATNYEADESNYLWLRQMAGAFANSWMN